MRDQFDVAAGSVVGTDHLRAGKNGHDGLCVVAEEDCIVAVVTDGCGSGAHSEVGAKLGAAIAARALREMVRTTSDVSAGSTLWPGAASRTLAALSEVAAMLATPLERAVYDYLLFTVVGVVVTPGRTAFFSCGDGVYAANGTTRVLGPWPGNAPPYLGYALVDESAPTFTVERVIPTADVDNLAIATDGAAAIDLGPFWNDPRSFRNPDAVRRRLYLLSKSRLLPDDTTVVTLRRRAA
jgi:hypothetical protein